MAGVLVCFFRQVHAFFKLMFVLLPHLFMVLLVEIFFDENTYLHTGQIVLTQINKTQYDQSQQYQLYFEISMLLLVHHTNMLNVNISLFQLVDGVENVRKGFTQLV